MIQVFNRLAPRYEAPFSVIETRYRVIDDNGKTVADCFSKETAELIATALNRLAEEDK